MELHHPTRLNTLKCRLIYAQPLRVIYTPGHTPGSICLQADVDGIEGKKLVLFTGDVHGSDPMRKEMMTVTGYPGNVEDFKKSIRRLSTLQPDIVLPSHCLGNAARDVNGAVWLTSEQWQSFLEITLKTMEKSRLSP